MSIDLSGLFQSPSVRDQFANWFPQQRWFATKSLRVSNISVTDWIDVREDAASSQLLSLLSVELENGHVDLYAVPLRVQTSGEFDFEVSADFWLDLLRQTIAAGTVLQTDRRGRLVPEITSALRADVITRCRADEVHVHSGQQSNTSVSIGSEYFLKLFRRPQRGLNPDAEVGAFLTEHGFKNTPAVAATLIYEPAPESKSEPRCLAIMSQQLDAESEAWSFCLNRLSQFWKGLKQHPQLLASTPPAVSWQWDQPSSELNSEIKALMSESVHAATLLSQRTAELHVTLAKGTSSAFRPEPLLPQQWKQIVGLIRAEIGTTEKLAVQRRDVINSIGATEFFESFSRRASELLDSLTTGDCDFGISMIRVHGDYHLGQVLRANDDFHIIDFEGEPDRPLAERREKRPVFKDIAGMVRSFHYASNAGAVGLIDGLQDLPPNSDVSGWQRCWFAVTARAYLTRYFQGVTDAGLVPQDPVVAQRLLNVFLLEKALYELRYELNNRPDWAQIPLIGLRQVLGTDS